MTDTINGRTPEEIKKGLEYFAETDLSKKLAACKQDLKYWYAEDVAADALAYIQQLERERDAAVAEVESLNAEIDAINEDYLSGIHTVREDARPKWISVEERLPEEDVTVLVYRDGCCGVARLLDAEPEIMWTYTGFGGDPTHWMPLPEPPKEET